MNLQAGRLRHRVTIQALTRTVSPASGQKLVTYTNGDTVWADVRPREARERLQAGQVVHEATHVVTMRYRKGLTPDCRLLFRARELDIVGVVNVGERNVELQVLAKER